LGCGRDGGVCWSDRDDALQSVARVTSLPVTRAAQNEGTLAPDPAGL